MLAMDCSSSVGTAKTDHLAVDLAPTALSAWRSFRCPVAIRIPRAVVCLISALAHHGLTTQVPHAVDIALPSHAQIPKIDGIPLRVFWYSEPSFSAGIDVTTIDDVPVRIYSPEKTVADCFKYRNKIGLDVAVEALRAWRDRKPKADFQSLSKFAQINRVQRIMRPYLEAIL
jgi:predicted transcriptional regulator of viral defense system